MKNSLKNIIGFISFFTKGIIYFFNLLSILGLICSPGFLIFLFDPSLRTLRKDKFIVVTMVGMYIFFVLHLWLIKKHKAGYTTTLSIIILIWLYLAAIYKYPKITIGVTIVWLIKVTFFGKTSKESHQQTLHKNKEYEKFVETNTSPQSSVFTYKTKEEVRTEQKYKDKKESQQNYRRRTTSSQPAITKSKIDNIKELANPSVPTRQTEQSRTNKSKSLSQVAPSPEEKPPKTSSLTPPRPQKSSGSNTKKKLNKPSIATNQRKQTRSNKFKDLRQDASSSSTKSLETPIPTSESQNAPGFNYHHATERLKLKEFKTLNLGDVVYIPRGLDEAKVFSTNYEKDYKDYKAVYACVNYEYTTRSRPGQPQTRIPDWNKKLQRKIIIDGKPHYTRERTHLVPWRYCGLEDDRVLINGTTHLNRGDRPTQNYIVKEEEKTYIPREPRFVNLIEKFSKEHLLIYGKYLTRHSNKDKDIPEGTHYSLEDFEEYSSDYMRKEKDKIFVYYGIGLYENTDLKTPPVSVEIGFYNVTDEKFVFRALLDNVD